MVTFSASPCSGVIPPPDLSKCSFSFLSKDLSSQLKNDSRAFCTENSSSSV